MPGDSVSDCLELPGVTVDIDDAVCLGLILNELVTNAFKHARPADRGLSVRIAACHAGAVLRFEIEDDGLCLPADLRDAAVETAGTTLVGLMSDQLGAKLVHHPQAAGTRVELEVPASRLLAARRPGRR